MSWGPYLWADGLGSDRVVGGIPGRRDGLEWRCSDFNSDGIHPSASGRQRVSTIGRRSPDWIKITDVTALEVVIGGWRPGEGRRAATFGSLLVGRPAESGLHSGLLYVGQVGTGFTEQMLATLMAKLRPLERKKSPFVNQVPPERARGAHWVQPSLVGEVVFREWTADGRMRAPSWRGLRPDRDPEDL